MKKGSSTSSSPSFSLLKASKRTAVAVAEELRDPTRLFGDLSISDKTTTNDNGGNNEKPCSVRTSVADSSMCMTHTNRNEDDQSEIPNDKSRVSSTGGEECKGDLAVGWDEDRILLGKYRAIVQMTTPSYASSNRGEVRKKLKAAEHITPATHIKTSTSDNERLNRSARDYDTKEALRQALSLYTAEPDCGGDDGSESTGTCEGKKPATARSDELLSQSPSTPEVSSSKETRKSSQQDSKPDWLLSVVDTEAKPQTLEMELLRLWNLKTYHLFPTHETNMNEDDPNLIDREHSTFLLSVQKLCQEACHKLGVRNSAISVVDLGRQFFFPSLFTINPPTNSNGTFDEISAAIIETPRRLSCCAHTILSNRGMMVVPDTFGDKRFQANAAICDEKQLKEMDSMSPSRPTWRFYAGATLTTPEGYNLGTFCISSSEPKPQGLTLEQEQILRGYGQRAMDLLLQRKQRIDQQSLQLRQQQSLDDSTKPAAAGLPALTAKTSSGHKTIGTDLLRKHSGITTNLGGILYYEGDLITAMLLFQESVQTLMCLESLSSKKVPALATQLPLLERHEEMAQLLSMLMADTNTPASRRAFCAIARKFFTAANNTSQNATLPPIAQQQSSNTLGGFPGMFCHHSSKLRGAERDQLVGLIFAEPFQIDVNVGATNQETEQKHFIIPLDQCSKATLFNMGLIHYSWGRADTAMQFFDLASSMSQQLSPLAFDPVILASLNNRAQIHLQFGRTSDAMDLLLDALTRGNAALAALYGDERADWNAENAIVGIVDARCSRRLRRKLARTVMNMGHVHFTNCNYNAAITTCHDALRLLHPNTEDSEVASVWHNMGISLYHQGKKEDACKYLEMFIERAKQMVGPHHLQLADAQALLGVAIFEMGNFHRCMGPLNEALKIRKLKYEKNHPSIAESLCSIGRVLLAREEYEFCLRAFLEGLAIHRAAAGPAGLSFDTAQTLLDIGRSFHAQNRLAEAIDTYEEVTVLTRRFFGIRSAFVARILIIKSNLHLELGQVDIAIEKFAEAMRIHLELGLPLDFAIVKDPLYRVQHNHFPAAAAT